MNVSLMEEKCVNSAVWAAYGDSLGFITELADSSLVRKRYGDSEVFQLRSWKKRVGGRVGIDVMLPKGTYSDDTQLRLSTSRAISENGYFDVESFAKIELPVWLSYALGAGRGTKEAAANLIRRDVNWFSNFFRKKGLNYFDGGGNGAAMRIQPHVWIGSKFGDENGIILDVMCNAITTHGHPRGFLGAIFHARCLYYSLMNGRVAGPKEWLNIVNELVLIPSVIQKNRELKSFWLPAWEQEKGCQIEVEIKIVQEELRSLIEKIDEIISGSPEGIESQYYNAVTRVGGFEPATRGSGTICAVLASLLAWLYREESPLKAIKLAANVLHSDTDSIATMCGSLLGAVNPERPPEEVLDQSYIEYEVTRLLKKNNEPKFSYPDVSSWRAPRTQSDALALINDELILAGLGRVYPISEPLRGMGGTPQIWQWCKLAWGQTVLLKRGTNITEAEPMGDIFAYDNRLNIGANIAIEQQTTLQQDTISIIPRQMDGQKMNSVDLEDLSSIAIKSGFDEAVIGSHILLIADSQNAIELVVAYSAIIAKARISRNKHLKK